VSGEEEGWWANRVAGNAGQMSGAGGGATAISDLAPEVADATSPAVDGGSPFPSWMRTGWNAVFGNRVAHAVLKPAATILHPVVVAAEWWNRDVYQPYIDDTAVGLNLMLAAPVAKRGDESLGEYLKYAWGARDELSLGQSQAAIEEEAKAGSRTDQTGVFVDPIHNIDAFKDSLNPVSTDPITGKPMIDPETGEVLKRDVNWHTGSIDFVGAIMLDPLNYVGGPTKAITTGLRAPKLVDDIGRAQTAWSRAKGVMSVDRANELLQEGKMDPVMRRLAEITDTKVARQYIEDVKLGADDPDTLAYLTSQINDPERMKDLFGLALRPTSEGAEEALARLSAAHGVDVGYYVSKYIGHDPLLVEMLQSPDDLLLGPKTQGIIKEIVAKADAENSAALERELAFSQGIYKMSQSPTGVLSNAPTTNRVFEKVAFSGVGVGKYGIGGAARKTARYSEDPVVSRYKPHRYHPTTWYIEKPSGLVEPGSANAFEEIDAAIRQGDRLTNGSMTRPHIDDETGIEGPPMATQLADRWFRASTLANPESERGAVAAALNDYIVNELMKIRHPELEPAARRAATETLLAKSKKIQVEIGEKGFLTVALDEGGTGILKYPALQRATPNSVPLYDYRAFDRAIQKDDTEGLRLKALQAMEGTTTGMDALMGTWKVSVLIRLGYTMRNLAEAGMSIAASGNLGNIIGEVGPERMKTWLQATTLAAPRAIDHIGIAGGLARDPEAISTHIQSWEGALRATEASSQQVMDALSPRLIARLARTDPAKAAKLDAIRVNLAARETTHHANDVVNVFGQPASWKPSKSRYLSTTPSRTLAQANAPVRGGAHEVTSYGETLDLAKGAAPPEFDAALVNRAKAGDQGAIQSLSDAAWNKGYGRIVLPDGPQWRGQQVIVNQRAIGRGAAKQVVANRMKRYAAEAKAADVTEHLAPLSMNPVKVAKERRQAKVARNKGRQTPLPINLDYDKELTDAMLAGGVQDFAQALADRRAALLDQIDYLSAHRENAREWVQLTAPLASRGRGFQQGTHEMRSRAGVDYGQQADAFGGHLGGFYETRISPDTTYAMTAGDSYRAQMATGAMANKVVKPENPRYFEAWANILNRHFRDTESHIMDPVVEQAISGKTFDEIYDWATKTPEGYQWAHSLGISDIAERPGVRPALEQQADLAKPENIEKSVASLMSAVDLYLPPGPIRDAFLAGDDVTEDLLRISSRDQPLVDLDGLLVPTSKEAADARSTWQRIGYGQGKLMRVLGSIPESSVARSPMFATAFHQERRNLLAIAEEGKRARAAEQGLEAGPEVGRMTPDEMNKLTDTARRRAERTVEKTLFTINRRSTVSGNAAVRTMFPFVAAYENVLQRWTGFIGADPMIPLRYANYLSKASQSALVVDENGTPIEHLHEWTGKELLVLPTPPLPGKMGQAAKVLGTQVQIPLKSFDVLTQGQPLNPGMGPLTLVPMVMLMKHQPSAEQYLKWAVPYGLPETYTDIFLPSAMKKAMQITNDGQLFANRVSKANLIMVDRWEKGGRQGPMPTGDDAKKMAQSMTLLAVVTSLTAPVAVSYTNERDWYAGKLHDYQEKYGQDEGETRFFTEFPDAGLLVESLSRNPTGVRANAQAVANARKYSGQVLEADRTGNKDVAGWLMNYDIPLDAEFSQASYQWQQNHGASGTTGTPFRTQGDPNEQVKEAHIRTGWDYYRKAVDAAEAQLTMGGVDPLSKQYRETMAAVKKGVVESIAIDQGNTDWLTDHGTFNTEKYNSRAAAFNTVLNSPQFMAEHGNDPLVRSMQIFLALRGAAEQLLKEANLAGGASELSAVKNTGLRERYEGAVDTLRMQSPEFNTWWGRFFPNDAVKAAL
jgi:hypothetical protein